MAKASKQKAKPKWTSDKSKLDNARKLRGIYFIVPEYAEFTETSKKCAEKVGNPDGPGNASQDEVQQATGRPVAYWTLVSQNFAYSGKANESTRMRSEGFLPKNHEDHIAGKRE